MRSSYFKWLTKENTQRFDATDLVYMNSPYIYARYKDSTILRMKLIPPHNFGPRERCYYELTTDFPGIVISPFGKGRGIFIPWSPGALFHQQGHVNTSDFCSDVLEGFAGISPFLGNLSPMVEVTHYQSDDGTYHLIHLVNGSGHFGSSFYPPVSMHDIQIEIAIEGQIKSVKGLRCGRPLPYELLNGQLSINLPQLGLFEVIKIDLT
jgi:hypothetical protein